MEPDYILTEDSVYSYYEDDDRTFYIEGMDLSAEWLKILKQQYGVGYIQKMLLKKQEKFQSKIDDAYVELKAFKQKLAKVEENNDDELKR